MRMTARIDDDLYERRALGGGYRAPTKTPLFRRRPIKFTSPFDRPPPFILYYASIRHIFNSKNIQRAFRERERERGARVHYGM